MQDMLAGTEASNYIRQYIRTVPNWPQKGVNFRDITPLLQNAEALHVLVDIFVKRYQHARLSYIAGLDARGFIIAPIVAYQLGIGFIPIRKQGKLPFKTFSESYTLEYGVATVEVHQDACQLGDRIVIIDDLIATGGTMMAGKKLLERLGATIVECAGIIDLPDLGGSALFSKENVPLFSVIEFKQDDC